MSSRFAPVTRARFKVYRSGEALVVEMSGLYTLESARDLRQITINHLELLPAERVLLDLRSTVLVLSLEQLDEVTAESLRSPVVKIPTGLLVLPIHEDLAWRHCATMAENGRVRMLFTDASDALSWAGVAPKPRLNRPIRAILPVWADD